MPCEKMRCSECGKLKEPYLTMNPKGSIVKVTADGKILKKERKLCRDCGREVFGG